MAGQPWLAASLAVLMIATAAYCLARLGLSWVQRRRTDRQVDAVHALMGIAMAGMLLPHARLPWTAAWEIIFGAASATIIWRIGGHLRRRPDRMLGSGHDLQHLLGCAAMLFMLAAGDAAAAPARGMTAAAGARSGTLALALAVALLASVVSTADRLTMVPAVAGRMGRGARLAVPRAADQAAAADPGIRAQPGHRPAPGPAAPLSPRLAASCEIAMGLTMGYMLITML